MWSKGPHGSCFIGLDSSCRRVLSQSFLERLKRMRRSSAARVANMHLDKQTRIRMGKKHIGGYQGKAVVMGLLERHGEARVKVLPNIRQFHIRTNIIGNVEKGSMIYSDALKSYENVNVDGFAHEFIDHAEEYVRGAVRTNGLENFLEPT
jgi:transposase-like protein